MMNDLFATTAPANKRAAVATHLNWLMIQLKAGRRVTPLDALRECGSMRLGARVYDLRQEGWEIGTDMSEGHATYWLKAHAAP